MMMRTINTVTNSMLHMAAMLRCAVAGMTLLASCAANAADFSLQDLQGKPHSLAVHRGHWVLVNFWATWCPPCLSEIPELNELQAAHADLVVIGVAMQSGSSAKVADFATAHHMRYPLVMGSRAIADEVRLAAAQTDLIEGLPTSFLFNPKGELVYPKLGELRRVDVEKYLSGKKTN
jgi:thiol-disulfide isomerase/thioredoxin